MTVYSKFNIIYRLQKWLDSVPGQTFMNYAYSWGASIVILGTLFKLTHLPGANFMLFLGMGTEVVVFFIAAFDRPFDKTADGMDLPTHVEDDELIPAEAEQASMAAVVAGEHVPTGGVAGGGIVGGNGGTIIIGGGASLEGEAGTAGTAAAAGTASGGTASGGSISWVQQQQEVSPEMADATTNYVDELKKLTEMLGKVNEQSERLTRDSEEMENLNRTLTGISRVYEMQLKSASQQMGTIDEVNEQTRRMAEQIAELNRIYARMIEAMTVNMKVAAPAATQNNA